MIQIISHRGYWKTPAQKNSLSGFKRALELGFGIETDIRDYCGELVISHDIAHGQCMPFSEFLELYNSYPPVKLALNIKADGLDELLSKALLKNNITDYFVFDMSVPDGLIYINKGLKVFTRQSEFESPPSFYEKAIGVWLDGFLDDWANGEIISHHLNNNKQVCIVSSELHKRPYLDFWRSLIAYSSSVKSHDIMLCTDFPEEARIFFNDSN